MVVVFTIGIILTILHKAGEYNKHKNNVYPVFEIKVTKNGETTETKEEIDKQDYIVVVRLKTTNFHSVVQTFWTN